MSAANRKRGQRAEVQVVNYLRDQGWPDARRYLSGDGRQPGDIDWHPLICLEVKDVAKSAWPTWCRQAAAEAPAGTVPVVVRRSRGLPVPGIWECRVHGPIWIGVTDDKRPMHPSWVRDLRDRCMLPELTEDPQDRHTAFFFKQWGTWGPDMPDGSFGTVYSRWDEDQIGTVLGVFDHGGSVRTRTERLEGADSIQAVYATGRAWRMEKGRKDRRILDGQTWDDFPHVSAAVSS